MQTEIFLIGSLDVDSEQRFVKNGDYVFAENLHFWIDDTGNAGEAKNLKGNTNIAYTLPEGKNKVIGKFNDIQGQSIIYFVWNSKNNHSILQYVLKEDKVVKVLQDPILNFNKDFLITGVSLIQELLYWTDPFDNPKKINIEKAKLTSNPPTDRWTFFDNSGNFNIKVKGVVAIGFISQTPHTFKVGDKTIIVQDAGAVFSQYNGFTTILAVNSGLVSGYPYDITIDKQGIGNTPPNGGYAALSEEGKMPYLYPLKNTYFTQLKPPPMINPKVEYISSNNNINYLQGKLFQFKALFVYDDLEQTKTSAISTTALPDENDYFQNNNISINSGIQITVGTGNSIVKRIRILAREGNTGNFFFIADLDKEKLGIADDSTYNYIFYNDKSYSFIDPVTSNLLFDAVPDLSKAQEIIEGERLGLLNITEGFDPIDVDLNVSVKINPVDVSGLGGISHSIKGKIFIRNSNYSGNEAFFQPICIDADDNTQGVITFGGLNVNEFGSKKYRFENGIVNDFKQSCELGGFPVYLKATNFYSISKQAQISGVDDLSQNENGVLNANDSDAVFGISRRRNAIADAVNSGKVFSEFEIKNVPDGTYILRIGSHLTTQNELNSGNLSWQNKSTYVSQLGGIPGFELTITVNGADVIIGDSVIQDLIDARLGHSAAPVAGYLKDGSSSIELAKVLTSNGISLKTDHNGFFFRGQENTFSLASVQVYNGVILTNSFSTTNGQLTEVTLTASDSSQLTSKRSILSGKITDNNGDAVSGVKVIFERGGEGTSGADGNYQMTVYGDTFALPNPARSGTLFFIAPSGSSGTFNSKSIFKQVLIPTPITDLNSVITVIADRALTGLKRGGDYEISVMYYNFGNQNGSANTRKELVDGIKFHIPFPTEKNPIPPLTPEQQTQIDLLNTALATSFETEQAWKSANNITTTQYRLLFELNDAQEAFNSSPTPSNSVTLNNARQAATNGGVFAARDNQIIEIANASAAIYISDATAAEIDVAQFITDSNEYKIATTSGTRNFVSASLNAGFNVQSINNTELVIKSQIDTITDNFLSGFGVPEISYSITSQPPEYATHWQLAITKNNSLNRYFQWAAKTVTYLDAENAATTSFEDAIYIRLDLESIVDTDKKGFLGVHKNSKVSSYTYTDGDRVRFVSFTDNTLFPTYIDVPVLGVLAGASQLAIIDKRDSLKDIKAGVLFEIYNPKLKLDTNIFFEVGDRQEIGDAGFSTRYHKNASGILNAFDTYYRVRVIPYSDGAINSVNNLEAKRFIEDLSFSDLYISNVSSYGRPQILNKNLKRVHRPTMVVVSNRFIPDTQVNGLNSFDGQDIMECNKTFGSIQKAYIKGKQLIVFQENRTGFIPILQNQLFDNDGNELMTNSANILNPIIYYGEPIGIALHPESFAENRGKLYWWYETKGYVCRLSNDGITVISDYKMFSFFQNKAKEIINSKRVVNVYGEFDVKFGEYILAFETLMGITDSIVTRDDFNKGGQIFDDKIKERQIVINKKFNSNFTFDFIKTELIAAFTNNPTLLSIEVSVPPEILIEGKTLAFNEEKNRWTSFYSYKPEMLANLNNSLFTFKDGGIWKHNDNEIRNNFYSEQSKSTLRIIENQSFSKTKSYGTIATNSNKPLDFPLITTPPNFLYVKGMKTKLVKSMFRNKEGTFYATLLRNMLSPNRKNELDSLNNGDVMKGNSLDMTIESNDKDEMTLFSVNVGWIPSEKS